MIADVDANHLTTEIDIRFGERFMAHALQVVFAIRKIQATRFADSSTAVLVFHEKIVVGDACSVAVTLARILRPDGARRFIGERQTGRRYCQISVAATGPACGPANELHLGRLVGAPHIAAALIVGAAFLSRATACFTRAVEATISQIAFVTVAACLHITSARHALILHIANQLVAYASVVATRRVCSAACFADVSVAYRAHAAEITVATRGVECAARHALILRIAEQVLAHAPVLATRCAIGAAQRARSVVAGQIGAVAPAVATRLPIQPAFLALPVVANQVRPVTITAAA